MKYQNYIFDLYGTLVDIRTDENSFNFWLKISNFFKFHHAKYQPQQLKKKYFHLIKKAYQKQDEIQIETIFFQLYAYKGVHANQNLIQMTCKYFRETSRSYICLYPWTIPWLDQLKKENKKIYLLSNAQHSFTFPEIIELELDSYFDDILISSDYHLKKPNLAFFQVLIQKYHLNLKETIMIGNDINTDILGAKKAGLATYYIHTAISPAYDDSIHSDYCILEPSEELLLP